MEEFEKQRQVIAGFFLDGLESSRQRQNAHFLATSVMGMELIATIEHLFTKRPTLTKRCAERCVDLILRGYSGLG